MKHLIILTLFAWSLLSGAEIQAKSSTDYAVIEDKATLPILTPAFSERQTLKIRLANGLEAYIISDPQVDKSSAALAVKTGSWEDPNEYPGIAHFLEHMLFLGTKKYPIESEYDSYISRHGGLSNAFTTNDFTTYLFAVDNSAFPEALDRFANFFIEPLFNPSGVSRELNAIDQEYAKNIENDDFREYYILKELTNPSHPNRGFSIGNHDSLLKVSQNVLKDWYAKHYSANRMRLIVISNHPLDEMKTLVINDFSSVPNSDLTPFDITESMLSDAAKGHMIYIEPVKNIRKLSLIWELPPKFADMRDTKPDQLICNVLGHEGKKSLLAQLKKEKLAEGIKCGSSKLGGHNFVISLEVSLTDTGVKNVNDVAMRCFEAIANFRNKGVPQYLFDELHTLQSVEYQYQVPQEAFSGIMSHALILANENMDTYPEQSNIIQRFDPKAVEEFLKYLTPENCIFDLMAPSTLTGVTPDLTERWFQVAYAIKPISKELLTTWAQATPNSRIDLPEPNPFIPEHLAKVTPTQTSNQTLIPTPTAVLDTDKGKVYFAKDERYLVPTICWTFEIKTPSITSDDPESFVLADLFVKSATEALNTYTYPAQMAGLNYAFSRSDNGLSLTIQGYSDKAELFFLDFIRILKDFNTREQQFKIYKDTLLREYQDGALDTPIAQAYELLRSFLYKNFVMEKNKALAIKKITFDRFETFKANLFDKTYLEGIMYGNMHEDQAKHLVSQLLASLGSQPYPKASQPKKQVIVLSEENGPYIMEMKSKTQGNAALLTIQTVPSAYFSDRGAQTILMQALKQPFFSTLRTKQQTGYIVMSKPEELELHLFDLFGVQSNTHDSRDLIARFELFLEDFMRELPHNITQDRFEDIKQALLASLQQPPKNIPEMTAMLHRLAFDYDGDFNWIDKRIKGLESISYDEFLGYTKETLGKQNKRRLAILFNGVIPEDTAIRYKKAANLSQIRKLVVYEPAQQPKAAG